VLSATTGAAPPEYLGGNGPGGRGPAGMARADEARSEYLGGAPRVRSGGAGLGHLARLKPRGDVLAVPVRGGVWLDRGRHSSGNG
jgi:hypothetical protein